MIDASAIKVRFDALAPFLDERGRRLFAAIEARAAGRGGVTAMSQATGIARSTIGRGLADLHVGAQQFGTRVRRVGGGGKPAIATQPGKERYGRRRNQATADRAAGDVSPATPPPLRSPAPETLRLYASDWAARAGALALDQGARGRQSGCSTGMTITAVLGYTGPLA